MFSLSNFGYSSTLKEKERRYALKKALKSFRVSKVIDRLKSGSIFAKSIMPDIYHIYTKDIKWIKNNFINNK